MSVRDVSATRSQCTRWRASAVARWRRYFTSWQSFLLLCKNDFQNDFHQGTILGHFETLHWKLAIFLKLESTESLKFATKLCNCGIFVEICFEFQVQSDVGLTSATVACVATSCSVVTAGSDSTLHCFSISDGSRLMAAVQFQAPAALLRAQDHFVCVITTHAHIEFVQALDRAQPTMQTVLNLMKDFTVL